MPVQEALQYRNIYLYRESFIMMDSIQQEFTVQGFAVIDNILHDEEINVLASVIENTATDTPAFRKTADLFAIRRFLKTVPAATPLVLTSRLTGLIHQLLGKDFFITKSIYFDKPVQSNWFVAWHQDLTISVDKKEPTEGFGPWTVKDEQFAVQPPVNILENNFTLRIHLDDTDEQNGALKVIPGSHLHGVVRPQSIADLASREVTCPVPRGGVMLMRPLLLHASGRTTNQQRRRVIHIEFSNTHLPPALQWAEKMNLS
ncbi:MAG: phytanoyl-CoA dioxygenase family protein [Chitinophagaceae bacterium]